MTSPTSPIASGSAGAVSAASDDPWLSHMPVSLFASVMGIAGLGLAWRHAAHMLGAPGEVSAAILILAGGLFALLAGMYFTKLIRHPAAVRHEWAHVVRCNFFPAMTIGLLLLSLGVMPWSKGAAESLFLVGAVGHLLFCLTLLNRWIFHPHEIIQINPAWFIPVVGNILVPIPGMALGYVEMSWFFFSLGAVLWTVMQTIVFYRVIFHAPMAEKLLPTLCILLAPPSIGFVSWDALNGGVPDAFGRILFYFAVTIFLLLLTALPRFRRLPFGIPFWAFTFPADAFAIAAFRYSHWLGDSPALMQALLWGLTGLATVIVSGVFLRTLLAIRQGRIFVPE